MKKYPALVNFAKSNTVFDGLSKIKVTLFVGTKSATQNMNSCSFQVIVWESTIQQRCVRVLFRVQSGSLESP